MQQKEPCKPFGNFDFNKTPIAVAGTKVVSYETPAQRRTFAPHGVDAFYVGPAEDHYRCVKVFVPATNDVRVVPTLDWFPSKIPFPKVTAETYLQQTANDLLEILKEKKQQPIPSLNFGSETMNAFVEVGKILERATTRPEPEPRRRPTVAPIPAEEPRVIAPVSPVPVEEPRVIAPASPHPNNQQRVEAPSPPPPAVRTTAPVLPALNSPPPSTRVLRPR